MSQLFAWSFRFSIIPSKEHAGLISFRMDWLGLLAVQGTLKSLLQHRSSKTSILWRLAFFTVQLLHPYMTTGKTIALTRWTFFGRVMSVKVNKVSSYNCHPGQGREDAHQILSYPFPPAILAPEIIIIFTSNTLNYVSFEHIV